VTVELVVFALVRIAGSLPVLRWPFAGGLVAVAVDFADLFVRDGLGAGAIGDYQAVDKWLDQVYLGAFLLVAVRWPDPERAIAVGLYLGRLVGFALFELSGDRFLLVVFPNVFEVWFLLVAALRRRLPPGARLAWSWRRLAFAVGAATSLKLGHEVALHGLRLFDGYTTRTALEAIGRAIGQAFGVDP
jgi:hypothetical protein